MYQIQSPLIFSLRIVLAGDYGCGKTSLLVRFADDKFYENAQSTIGIDFRIKTIEVNDITCKLQIWDVAAGQTRYRPNPCSYYRAASGIIILYDVTNRQSFESIPHQLAYIKKSILHFHNIENVTFMIVGTKIDLDFKEVSTKEASDFAKQNNLLFQEISNVIPINVHATFQYLTSQIISKQYDPTTQKYLTVEQLLQLLIFNILGFLRQNKDIHVYDCMKQE